MNALENPSSCCTRPSSTRWRNHPHNLIFILSVLQVNKGPVDYVTHEARYSLSEEKLIRQQVNESESDGVVSQESESVE